MPTTFTACRRSSNTLTTRRYGRKVWHWAIEHRYTWSRDTGIVGYLREQLARIPYRSIGEFHLCGEDARNPVVADVITLARERDLALHAHTDVVGIQALLAQAPDNPVIWAHGGFDVPEPTLRDWLAKHSNLYIELSFREAMTESGKLTSVWHLQPFR